MVAVFFLPRLLTGLYAQSRVQSVEEASTKPVAIVFGAGLWRDGSPTPVLRDRVATAADLYFVGKVEKLLMSGDNRADEYNEPGAMKNYAIGLGVPDEDIVLDYAGWRTYDTCYRARHIFGVRNAILVTQAFHLPRAIYTCNMLGVSASGVPADRRIYRRGSRTYWNLREVFATHVALWEVHVSHPLPVLGNPEPIFPREAQ
jgi:vancomycin permeability regulator SanA